MVLFNVVILILQVYIVNTSTDITKSVLIQLNSDLRCF
jgi:Skp family chaperone for outer membrane proteins